MIQRLKNRYNKFIFNPAVLSAQKKDVSVALLGDSLATSFNLHTNFFQTVKLAKKVNRNPNYRTPDNFFIGTEPSADTPISSLADRLSSTYEDDFEFYNFAQAGASLAGNSVFYLIKNFKKQVDQLLKLNRFPDLIIIWIGHNDLDWASIKGFDFNDQVSKIQRTFHEQLNRLRNPANKDPNHSNSIVVYGLINFRSFFKGRNQCEAYRSPLKNGPVFDAFDRVYKIYPSMLPSNRPRMIELADAASNCYKDTVSLLKNNFSENNIQLYYSDALTKVDISESCYLSPHDAWHPSDHGHNQLAETAWQGLQEALAFLNLHKTNTPSSSKK